jgi:DNA-binding beta-propeller fold protein YncE
MKFEYAPINYEVWIGGCADAAVDSQGRIFALCGPHPLTIFNQEGKIVGGWPEGIIGGGHGIYIDNDDYVYVIDSGWNVLSKFTTEGKLLLQVGNKGVPSDTGAINGNFKTIKRGAPPFYSPSKVTVSPRGEIFVTDGYGNARVHRFSAEGKLLASWGEPGGGPGEFRIPHGVGVDDENRVYVADRENNRVQIFDVEGKLLNIWEGINRPDGLCVRDGIVYVAELGHITYVDNVLYEPYENMPWSMVRIYDTAGHELTKFGEKETWKDGNLFAAHGANLDREGNLYIAEAGWPTNESTPPEIPHHALQKFRRVE